jgi:two-component system cell cycle response regulator
MDGCLVVIADDDELFRSYLSVMLTPLGLETRLAADGDELTRLIQQQMPDCIILDYDMTNENGIFVQEQLRARFPSLCPVLMLSADETQRTAIRAFRMGVDDFVQKRNLKLEEIQAAISRAIFSRRSRRAGDPVEPSARNGSSIDHVTGFYTREEIDARVARIQAIAERSGHPAAVFSIYFDPWQSLCHRVGLALAEKAMREFSRRLAPALRVSDICGRYGDDVLCCVWENCADMAVVEQRKAAMTAALSYTYNVGAAQFVITPRISAEIWTFGEDLLAQRLARMSDDFEVHRQANLAREAELDATAERRAGAGPFENERRRSVRRRIFKQGSIAINDGASRLPVNIRNISDGGAKIELRSVLAVPETFTLMISDFGGPRNVRKRWQTNEFIGVEFVD